MSQAKSDDPLEVTQRTEADALFFTWPTGAVLLELSHYKRSEAALLGVRIATGDERGTAIHPHVWPPRNHWAEQERSKR